MYLHKTLPKKKSKRESELKLSIGIKQVYYGVKVMHIDGNIIYIIL